MFGARYSRLKFWVISICLLIPTALINGFANAFEKIDNAESLTLTLYGVVFLLSIIWINTLANRIRDYGGNPWSSLWSFIPLVGLIMTFYYGIVKTKNKKVEEEINSNETSLSKAMYNHSKDIVEK